MIVQGCVISVPATYFDGHGAEKWSQQQYGDRWNTARCSGAVQRVLQGGQWCRLKWNIDGAVTRVAVSDLRVDEWSYVDSSNRTNVSDNGEGTEVTEVEQGESREEQTLSHEISTFSSDDDSSSCTEESSSSESEMSDDGVNEPTHGRGRKV